MKTFLKIIFVLTISFNGFSQNTSKNIQKWAFVANICDQKDLYALDFGSLQSIHNIPFRPMGKLGVERTWKKSENYRIYQDLKLSYFQDTYKEKVFGLTTDFGIERRIFKGLYISPRLGFGLNHAKAADVRYKYENEKWVKTKNNDPINKRVNLKAGLDLGYRFNNKFDIIIGKDISIVTPYISGSLELFGFKGTHIGTRIFF